MENDNFCPDCGNPIRRDKKNELICSKCGTVVGNYTPSPSAGKKTELGSVVDGVGPEDWKGVKHFKPSLKDLHEKVSFDKDLEEKLDDLKRSYGHQNVSQPIIETAIDIYKRARDAGCVGGRGKPSMRAEAAALYAACQMHNAPQSLDEIATSYFGEYNRENITKVGRAYKELKKKLGLKISPPCPEDYIPKICSECDLNITVQAKAIDILREASDKSLVCGCKPGSVAAAAVYIAAILCGEPKNQHEIADAARIREVTLRSAYRSLADTLGYTIQYTQSMDVLLTKKDTTSQL